MSLLLYKLQAKGFFWSADEFFHLFLSQHFIRILLASFGVKRPSGQGQEKREKSKKVPSFLGIIRIIVVNRRLVSQHRIFNTVVPVTLMPWVVVHPRYKSFLCLFCLYVFLFVISEYILVVFSGWLVQRWVVPILVSKSGCPIPGRWQREEEEKAWRSQVLWEKVQEEQQEEGGPCQMDVLRGVRIRLRST